jgi:FAD/FMN-containing dehydrogenase
MVVKSIPQILDESRAQTLKNAVRGDVIQPDSPLYDEARSVYNAMIDKRPSVIVRCVDVADVVQAVTFAGENGLPAAIRGGGHNVAGLAVVDDGLVVDLSRMKGIRIDLRRATVRVEGGATWGDLDHATHQFGYAVPGGIIASTGIGGLTLGGGIGHLTRRYGLSCDNLLSVDLVTADGQLITTSEHEHPDLFWALRGGGGNFGVVTSFEFQMHPVSTVFCGPVFYPVEKAGEVLRFFREFMRSAPEELNAFFAFQIGPPAPFIPEHLQGVTMCAIIASYSGPLDQAHAAVQPLREIGPSALDLLHEAPLPALNSAFDPLLPPGLHHYWKAGFVDELTDEAIDEHVAFGPRVPTVQSTMHIYPIDGAAHRVRKNESAFNHRDSRFAYVIAAGSPEPADMPDHRQWVRSYQEALRPHSAEGVYVNFMMDDEGQERVRATYRDNYDRLARIKARYDPGNLFRVNQNIRPKE